MEEHVEFASEIEDSMSDILFDPQTSGGLLIAVPEEQASDLLIELYALGVDDAAVVGEVVAGAPKIKVK